MNGHTICATFWRNDIVASTESVHADRFTNRALPAATAPDVGARDDAQAAANTPIIATTTRVDALHRA